MDLEKRTFARLALHADATIHKDDQRIDCEVEDLSMKGIFINAPQPMKENETVAVTIRDTPLFELKAKVVRVTDQGVGLQFEKTLFE
ncbi:PilZ domain-containing protein [Geomonas sp.]|uniref:PilZ domain-containing protein n=1 Tax=Geomonas sp. TaxID=2651584 RepID=UPI002B49C67B|nr:PilZ domain-containing protein [Geomonas sp.]HJV36489.1 PilZ domain-containing protein [Geomonas sp.]